MAKNLSGKSRTLKWFIGGKYKRFERGAPVCRRVDSKDWRWRNGRGEGREEEKRREKRLERFKKSSHGYKVAILEKSQSYDKSLGFIFLCMLKPLQWTRWTRVGGPQQKMAPCMNPLVSISDMYTHFMDLLPNLIALHIFQTTWKFLIFCFLFYVFLFLFLFL